MSTNSKYSSVLTKIDEEFFSPFTPRQADFIREYFKNGGDQTKAAKAAGYSEKNAKQAGSRLARVPKITNALKSLKAMLQESTGDDLMTWAETIKNYIDEARKAKQYTAVANLMKLYGEGMGHIGKLSVDVNHNIKPSFLLNIAGIATPTYALPETKDVTPEKDEEDDDGSSDTEQDK